jgi:exonuclease III
MTYVYKLATLNINGIAHFTWLRMMEGFPWKHDIDIILLQEVTNTQIDSIRRYIKYINIGAEQRRTAIMVKDGFTFTHIRRLPSGRGVAGMFDGTWFVNIYAPSGAEMKHDRETFYNTDLPYLQSTTWTELY